MYRLSCKNIFFKSKELKTSFTFLVLYDKVKHSKLHSNKNNLFKESVYFGTRSFLKLGRAKDEFFSFLFTRYRNNVGTVSVFRFHPSSYREINERKKKRNKQKKTIFNRTVCITRRDFSLFY